MFTFSVRSTAVLFAVFLSAYLLSFSVALAGGDGGDGGAGSSLGTAGAYGIDTGAMSGYTGGGFGEAGYSEGHGQGNEAGTAASESSTTATTQKTAVPTTTAVPKKEDEEVVALPLTMTVVPTTRPEDEEVEDETTVTTYTPIPTEVNTINAVPFDNTALTHAQPTFSYSITTDVESRTTYDAVSLSTEVYSPPDPSEEAAANPDSEPDESTDDGKNDNDDTSTPDPGLTSPDDAMNDSIAAGINNTFGLVDVLSKAVDAVVDTVASVFSTEDDDVTELSRMEFTVDDDPEPTIDTTARIDTTVNATPVAEPFSYGPIGLTPVGLTAEDVSQLDASVVSSLFSGNVYSAQVDPVTGAVTGLNAYGVYGQVGFMSSTGKYSAVGQSVDDQTDAVGPGLTPDSTTEVSSFANDQEFANVDPMTTESISTNNQAVEAVNSALSTTANTRSVETNTTQSTAVSTQSSRSTQSTAQASQTAQAAQTNGISVEAQVTDAQGNVTQGWTSGTVSVSEGEQLHLRWSAEGYSRCLPFIADNGRYSFTRLSNLSMTSGNTYTEGYDVRESGTATYRVECTGSSSNPGIQSQYFQVETR